MSNINEKQEYVAIGALIGEADKINSKTKKEGAAYSIKKPNSEKEDITSASDLVRELYYELLNVFFKDKSEKEIHDVFFDVDGYSRELEGEYKEYLALIKNTSGLCCITDKNAGSFNQPKDERFKNLRQGKNNVFIIINRDDGKLIKSVNDLLKKHEDEDVLRVFNDSAMYIRSRGSEMIVDFIKVANRIDGILSEENTESMKEIKQRFDKFKRIEISKNAIEYRRNKTADEENDDNKSFKQELDVFNSVINEKNKQVIFTGAPGTGKTYGVRDFVKRKMNQDDERYKFVQFHASYDYTDFVEGIRPVKLGENTSFVRMDGSFKKFCRMIVEDNLDRLQDKQIIVEPTDESLDNYKIEQLYSIIKERAGETNEEKEIREKAKKIILEKPYYYIIDEINRADLGKVFGELMFALEESYRGVENRFDTQYMNLDTYTVNEFGEPQVLEAKDDVFKKGFFIPENLYIIGTMNDIDRSVETFDFALRRRFYWKEIKADRDTTEKTLTAIYNKKGTKPQNFKELLDNIDALNKCIKTEGRAFGLNESYCIGSTYFKDYDVGNHQLIWDSKIQPLLKEYTRGRDRDKVKSFIENCAKAFFDCNVSDELKED